MGQASDFVVQPRRKSNYSSVNCPYSLLARVVTSLPYHIRQHHRPHRSDRLRQYRCRTMIQDIDYDVVISIQISVLQRRRLFLSLSASSLASRLLLRFSSSFQLCSLNELRIEDDYKHLVAFKFYNRFEAKLYLLLSGSNFFWWNRLTRACLRMCIMRWSAGSFFRVFTFSHFRAAILKPDLRWMKNELIIDSFYAIYNLIFLFILIGSVIKLFTYQTSHRLGKMKHSSFILNVHTRNKNTVERIGHIKVVSSLIVEQTN